MRTFKRIVPALLALLICLIALPASAAQSLTLAVSCPGIGEETLFSRCVDKNDYRLYLPGTWDVAAILFDLAEGSVLQAGNVQITPGAPVDLSGILGEKQPLTDGNGKRLGTLTVYQGSSIPTLHVTVDPGELARIHKSKNNEILSGRACYREADGTLTYDGALTSFKCRGNNTFSYKKKPYQIKLEKKADLSGMGKSKTWILLANYTDVSLLHNQVALDLAREIGVPFALSCQPVDLYINGEYYGLYLLTEKVQIGKERVNIVNLEEATEEVNPEAPAQAETFRDKTKANPTLRGSLIANDPADITGGYILEMEKPHRFREARDSGFSTQLGLCFTIKEPTCASRAQVDYIAALVNDFHLAVRAPNGHHPENGVYYADYIDMPSFALKYLLEDFTKNYDYRSGSQFFFKDSDAVDGKLYAGPAWDYDLTFGVLRNGAGRAYVSSTASRTNLWWCLSQHEDFRAVAAALYWERLRPACDILLGERAPDEGSCIRPLDAYQSAIANSAAMNYARWPAAGSAATVGGQSGKTFEGGVAILRKFVVDRLTFLDTYWPKN